jgi:hypothetical protein
VANITPAQQAVIDALAASLALEAPADAGSLASWKRTFGGYLDAVPGTYFFTKVTFIVNMLRADATLDQVTVEKLANFLGVP